MIHHPLIEYTMSEINFEALGRCQHLKDEINKAIRNRDGAFRSMARAYREQESHTVYDTVRFIDLEKMHQYLSELEAENAKVTALVEEYNRWAPSAGKSVIKFVNY